MKNATRTVNEIENILDAINSRLEKAEEFINDLEERIMESNQAKHVRGKKKLLKIRIDSATLSSPITFAL